MLITNLKGKGIALSTLLIGFAIIQIIGWDNILLVVVYGGIIGLILFGLLSLFIFICLGYMLWKEITERLER